jgi:serine/threonine protein kinase
LSPQDSDAFDYGDFVDSDDEGLLEEETEPAERYDLDLYYPICIGDVLVQTYRIVHKLGHGGYSTVWLARDIRQQKDLALKIMIHGNSGEDEYDMQKEIIHTVQDTSNILTCLTTFSLTGPNGHHWVLVFPVRGPSLDSCLTEMSMAARMSAAKQILKALECLHNAGIVHQDLNSGNVMWGVAPLDDLDTNTKYKILGRPQKIAMQYLWKWGELVKPMEVPKNLLRETVCISDFGAAFKAGTEMKQNVLPPLRYCAPERLHGADPSFAGDMWSYMCLFAELDLDVIP